jgi:TPP-dependent trihydroxycyclohexane-1,2-dione (THcHDO) dehydratase
MRLTVAQAIIKFLANQCRERDDVEQRLIAGCFGTLGTATTTQVARKNCDAHKAAQRLFL